MNSVKSIERLSQLIAKGEALLRTHVPLPPKIVGFPTLDSGLFQEWKTQSLSFLISLFGENHTYVLSFKDQIKKPYQNTVKEGIGILKAAQEDPNIDLSNEITNPDPILFIENICSQFHAVARQLRSRHKSRPTLEVNDEYDVQDLFHALLRLYFSDVRPEEYTPSYAGKASRIDFLLKKESIVIELKKTRPNLGVSELSTQLIEDIARYESHPNCKTLVCFVYDPEGVIPNPRGIEADLSREMGAFPVSVIIRPL